MPGFVLIYLSMSGNTKAIAEAIAEGARYHDVKSVAVDLKDATPALIYKADAIGIGSPTYAQRMLPPIENFLGRLSPEELYLKPCVAFGSYGWSGEAPWHIADKMRELGSYVVDPVIRIQYTPDEKEIESCKLLGKDVALLLKKEKRMRHKTANL